MKRCFAFLLTVFVALSLTAFAHAGTYPDKSIKIIVPFNPGGGGEQGARLLEKDFKEKVGQPLSFIYKPGGTGLIGMVELSRQKPDGYTIGIHSYPLLMLDIITGRAGYTLDSFDFISLLCLEEVYLAVRADSPVSSAKELIERAKSEPGRINLGICEIMGPTHIPALRLKADGVPFNHVPIDGAGKVAPALLGGQVEAAIVPSGGVSGSISKMKILAVFAPERSKRFPDAPTMKEVGYDINSAVGRYIAAPKGVPPKSGRCSKTPSRPSFPTRKSSHAMKMREPWPHGSPATSCARCLRTMKRKGAPWSSSTRSRRASSPVRRSGFRPLQDSPSH